MLVLILLLLIVFMYRVLCIFSCFATYSSLALLGLAAFLCCCIPALKCSSLLHSSFEVPQACCIPALKCLGLAAFLLSHIFSFTTSMLLLFAGCFDFLRLRSLQPAVFWISRSADWVPNISFDVAKVDNLFNSCKFLSKFFEISFKFCAFLWICLYFFNDILIFIYLIIHLYYNKLN